MPKTSTSAGCKVRLLSKEFEKECVILDNGNLLCSVCGITLGLTRFLIKQHLETKKHIFNRNIKLKQQTLPSIIQKDQFSMELCQVIFSLRNCCIVNHLIQQIKVPSGL